MKRVILAFCFQLTTLIVALAQDGALRGKVIDQDNNPLKGVSIALKETSQSTIIQDDESFIFNLSEQGVNSLIICGIGFNTQTFSIQDNQQHVLVTLTSKLEGLQEIVVVGYGTMKKSDLTGAVASVNAKTLNTIPTGNPIEALQGKISGVDIGSITTPGSTPKIRIRGNRSLNASNEPLYVVDGIPRNTIEDIPVNDIASLEVLNSI